VKKYWNKQVFFKGQDQNNQNIIRTRVRILPMVLIPKTTQNYKPLWVPDPKIPMEIRDKLNPTHTGWFFWVIPLGTHGYPPQNRTMIFWATLFFHWRITKNQVQFYFSIFFLNLVNDHLTISPYVNILFLALVQVFIEVFFVYIF
jgi:hypothetical protein